MFYVGDRVVCVKNYICVSRGEHGTVIGATAGSNHFHIRWDKFRSGRHDNGGLCERGHGWIVLVDDIVLESEWSYQVEDFGDIQNSASDITELF